MCYFFPPFYHFLSIVCHRDDPRGERICSLFRNTVYLKFDFMAAKSKGFFPAVEYLECLPLLLDGRDIPTYGGVLAEFEESRNLTFFLGSLEKSVVMCGMQDAQVKKKLTPQYVVQQMLLYQKSRRASGLDERQQALVFASSVDDTREIARLLCQAGVSAESLTHKTADVERVLKKFSAGQLACLVSCNMVNEGFDVPETDLVVFARCTESEIVFSQQLGRLLRQRGKSVTIFDLALNLRRRWKKLRADLPDAAVKEMILNFFPVSNFCGEFVE